MAAALADGTTIIENAAKEPEIEDLANALNGMGGQVHGAGGDIIHIEGVKELRGVTHRIIPDRIEAGSFIIAAALTGGEVLVKRARAAHLDAFLIKLKEAGVTLSADESGIRVRRNGKIKSVDVTTLPYPGFPTDLQAQIMVLMAVADGVSVITETIFENRFMHAQELDRMGAQIKLEGNRAIVRGVQRAIRRAGDGERSARQHGVDSRGFGGERHNGGARVYHLDRGYEQIERKLSLLGAQIVRVKG